jgi:hypothetical protein
VPLIWQQFELFTKLMDILLSHQVNNKALANEEDTQRRMKRIKRKERRTQETMINGSKRPSSSTIGFHQNTEQMISEVECVTANI